jgi:hypothetical protein
LTKTKDCRHAAFFIRQMFDYSNSGGNMSIIIIGGNERMERLYADVCKAHGCRAKVFTKVGGDMKKKLGSADLFIVFTNTVSHKMAQCALCEAKKCHACVARCHSSSLSSLKSILKDHCPEAKNDLNV